MGDASTASTNNPMDWRAILLVQLANVYLIVGSVPLAFLGWNHWNAGRYVGVGVVAFSFMSLLAIRFASRWSYRAKAALLVGFMYVGGLASVLDSLIGVTPASCSARQAPRGTCIGSWHSRAAQLGLIGANDPLLERLKLQAGARSSHASFRAISVTSSGPHVLPS